MRVHGREAVAVIIYVYPDDVLAFLDWRKRDQSFVESRQDGGWHQEGAWWQCNVIVIFDQIAVEQDHWEDEVLDDGVVELMNSQFERFILEVEIML